MFLGSLRVKMAPVKKTKNTAKILKYPESSMVAAIKDVRDGRFKIREAARHNGVPHSTLINKLKGKVPENRKMGRDTYLTNSEEKLLVTYIIANAKKGIALKRQTLVDTVKKIVEENGRKTPFKHNSPGRKWVDLFLKRHPQIKERCAEGISTARANVTESDLREWFNLVKSYMVNEDALAILEDPTRIYNADESGFQTCPESGKVLGPVGMKNFYEVKSGKEKEQLTVMVCLNAAGQVVAPMIVYPLVRISKDIATNVPENWAIGKSVKGWMTGPLYFEYIANVFDPWLKENRIEKPVLLLVDGHRSHMTLQVAEYCAKNKILVHALFPNSTHITQPADVSVFKYLKSGWQNFVFDYKRKTGNRHITRAGFAPLLSKVFEEKVTPEIITNGFKRCGIYPFDPSAVDYTKCMDHEVRKTIPMPVEPGVEEVLLLESFMRKGRTEGFRDAENSEEWKGDESAKELFYVWKKFRKHSRIATSLCEEPNQNKEQHITSPANSDRSRTMSPTILQTPPIAPMSRQTSVVSTVPEMVADDHSHSAAPVNTLSILETSPRASVSRRTSEAFSEPEMTLDSGSHTVDSSTPKNKLVQLMTQKQKQVSPAFANHILWPSDSPIKKNTKERLPLAVTSKYYIDYLEKKEEEKQKKLEDIESRKKRREENKRDKIKKKSKKTIESSDSEKLEDIENRKKQGKEKKRDKTKKDSKRTNKSSDSETEIRKRKFQGKRVNKKKTRRVIQSDSESDISNTMNRYEYQESEKSETAEDSENDFRSIMPNTLSAKENNISKGSYVIIIYEGEYFPGLVVNVDKQSYEVSTMTFSMGNTFRWPEKPDTIWYPLKNVLEVIDAPVLSNKRGFYVVQAMNKYLPFTV